MNVLHRWLVKLPNYVRRFGVIPGLRLLTQIERKLPQKSQRLRRYTVLDYSAPITLRETRSDHSIFWQCLVMCQYDTRSFVQNERLMSTYHIAIEAGERPLIIDCGANIGLATVWYARQFPEAII